MLGLESVEHAHRDMPPHRGNQGVRMQDLSAIISQLAGLLEAQGPYRLGRSDDSRIGGHDAVRVGPYLDLLRPQGGAEYRRRIVASVAAERGDIARFGAA